MNRRRILGLLVTGFFFLSVLAGTFEPVVKQLPTTPTYADPNTPHPAGVVIDEEFTGQGTNQTVRVYLQNSSELVHRNGSITLDAASSNSRLTKANASFYFERNYTTTYQIEDDSAFDRPRNVSKSYSYNVTNYGDYQVNGTVHGVDANITGEDPATYMNVTSITDAGKDIVNMSIVANFSGLKLHEVVFPDQGADYDYDYNRSLGLRFTVNLSVFVPGDGSQEVPMQASVWDWISSQWVTVGTSSVNLTRQELSFEIVNKNLRYINSSECAMFHLNFSHDEANPDFNVTIFNVNASAILAMEIPFGGANWTALEFDLRGDALLHGAYIWVRCLDTDFSGGDINLTLSVFRANRTGLRSMDDPGNTHPELWINHDKEVRARPDWTDKIYEVNYTDYSGDGYVLFNFSLDAANSQLLDISNYFIVLNSTQEAVPRFSLVVIPSRVAPESIPSFAPWDPKADAQLQVDHLLLKSDDNGSTWVRKFLKTSTQEGACDASPFGLNITRRWMPEEINASIEFLGIQNSVNKSYPYNETSPLEWGLGVWVNDFPDEIPNDGDYFNIDLNWTRSTSESLWFSCNLSVTAYSIENATSLYNYTTSRFNWVLNYTLDLSQYSQVNWSYVEFWYLFPNDWNTVQLVLPSFAVDNSSAVLQDNLTDYSEYNIMFSDQGTYSLTLSSPNYIYNITAFINFEDTLWPSQNFMVGDNVSVMAGVKDPNWDPSLIDNGDTNCSLYGFGGAPLAGAAKLNDSTVDEKTNKISLYKFDEDVLYEIPVDATPGVYTILVQWNNGSEIGCLAYDISITYYNLSISSVYLDPEDSSKNTMRYTVNGNNATQSKFSVFTFAGNSSGVQDLDEVSYGINQTGAGQVGDIKISQYLQNETFLNPGEWIEFNLTVQNVNEVLEKDIKVKVSLVYIAKEDWVLTSVTSPTVTLNYTGGLNDTITFNMSAQMPTDRGENCPLRYSAVKTEITFFENDEDLGAFLVDQKFALFTDFTESEYDGFLLTGKYYSHVSGVSFYSQFSRASECVLPGDTDYFVYVMDDDGLANQMRVNKTVGMKVQSTVSSVETTPTAVNWNHEFNVSGTVVDELGNPIGGVTLAMSRLDNGTWVDAHDVNAGTTITADADGNFVARLNSSQFEEYASNVLRVTWAGDSLHLALDENLSIPLTYYERELSISVVTPVELEGNKDNEVRLVLTNTGNCTLLNLTISNISFGQYTLSVLQLDQSELTSLAPGESITVYYKASIPRLSSGATVYFNVTVEAQVFETGEYLQTTAENPLQVSRGGFISFNQTVGLGLLFGGMVAVWGLLVGYIVRQRRKVLAESEAMLREKSRKTKPSKRAREAAAIRPTLGTPEKPKKETNLDELLKEVDKKK
ncbi:MAG: hypothetical protein ACTSU5_19520 [Promethearchaeota archaeon]